MFNKTRFSIACASVALLMSACTGSADPTVTPVDTSTAAAQAAPAPASAPAEANDGGEPTGTITLSDGTVIDLVVGDCKTKSTHPTYFLIDNGFDISGGSADDFYRFTAVKASFEGDPMPVVGLQGDRDENRVNPKIDYSNLLGSDDNPSTLVADGARVYGDVTLADVFSSTPVFGDKVTVAVEFNCG